MLTHFNSSSHIYFQFFNDARGHGGAHIGTLCPQCGQDFKTIELLASHQLSFEHFLDGTCNLCNKNFSTPHSLKRHFESVHLKVKVPCAICGSTFNRFDSVKRHCIKMHQMYPCKHCKAIFPNNPGLLEHSQVHKKVDQYEIVLK